MKKFCLLFTVYGLLLAGFSPASAFWANSVNLERTEQVIRIDHRGNNAEVTIDEVIVNNTGQTQTYRYLAPVSSDSQAINLYLDGNGLSYESLTGPDLLDKLWEEFRSQEQRDLLQLGQHHQDKVLYSETVELEPEESVAIKLKYRVPTQKSGDFYALSLNAADRTPSQNLRVSFNHVGTQAVTHFLASPNLSGNILKEGSGATWLHESKNTVLNQSLTFLWSEAPRPKGFYRYQNFDYQLELEATPAPASWETVTILIDQSGSMFGDRWTHSQQVVREFLKQLPVSTKFRVGFFDNEVQWFHELPVANSPEEQKRFFTWWESQIPTGRTDWSTLQDVLRDLQLQQSALSKTAGLIIGDFTQFEIDQSDYFQLKSFRRSLLLDYAENDLAQFWSRLNDGQYLPVLSQDEDLVQWPMLWSRWQSLHLAKNASEEATLPVEINHFTPSKSLFWMSRQTPSDSHLLLPQADFLPTLWAQYRVAGDLRRLAASNQLDPGKQRALNSIARVLGVDHPSLDIRLGSSGMYSALKALDFSELWRLIWNLESGKTTHENLFFQNGKPIFQIENSSWVSADFDNFYGLKSGLSISPGSEAEEKLFKFFPDLLGVALSLGDDLRFCADQRCLQLNPRGETTPEETHKLDWRARLKPHWANDYALKLAAQNTIKIDPWGDLELDKVVTRGEFIRWLVEWYFGPDFTERTAAIGDPRFVDVTDESTVMAEAIYLLQRKGVIQGYEDNTVRPNQTLTRAEAVKIILALDGFTPKTAPIENLPFRDIGGWETPWVVQAQKTGLVQGYGDGTFKPQKALTRGEGMKMMVTAFQ